MAISNDYGYYLNPIQKDDLVKNKMGIFKSRAERDYKTALEWFNKATQQGDHMGQYYMGVCYTYGYGVEKNYNLAVEWLQKSARQEDLLAKDLLKQFKRKKKSIIDRFLDLFR